MVRLSAAPLLTATLAVSQLSLHSEAQAPQRQLQADTWCLRFYGGGCRAIDEEELCLSSRDGGAWRFLGRQGVYGQPCLWCGENCTAGGARCTPANSEEVFPIGSALATCANADNLTDATFIAESLRDLKKAGFASRNLSFTPRTSNQEYEGQACRASSITDKHEKDITKKNYYSVWTAATLEECFELCKATQDCTGVEYRADHSYCEIWTIPIEATEANPGFECFAVNKSTVEPVAVVTKGGGDTVGSALLVHGGGATDGGVAAGALPAGGTGSSGESQGDWIITVIAVVAAVLLAAVFAGICYHFKVRKKDTPASKKARGKTGDKGGKGGRTFGGNNNKASDSEEQQPLVQEVGAVEAGISMAPVSSSSRELRANGAMRPCPSVPSLPAKRFGSSL
eukprot:gb/GFBE01076531.1/.p1 GENE.gb/GFBE01076531.1/~~gb/GFBE01076531.1/.p1  ORF type:complete len:398 (+),score=77.08 gb/GFBE01076531.1/:1-1194(+)